MKKITFPLKEGAQGSEISNLQDVLFLLLERNAFLRNNPVARQEISAALQQEYANEIFGSATRSMISIFQKEQNLKAGGAVDEPTAEAINTLLHKFEFLDENGIGLSKFIKLLWNAIWTGRWYRHNRWAEILRALSAQKRILSAINLSTDRLKKITEKMRAPGRSTFSFNPKRNFSLNMRDDMVKDLHAQLTTLGFVIPLFVIPLNERNDQIAGVGTHDALLRFQTKTNFLKPVILTMQHAICLKPPPAIWQTRPASKGAFFSITDCPLQTSGCALSTKALANSFFRMKKIVDHALRIEN